MALYPKEYMEWKHHHLRLTAFLDNAMAISENTWWKDIVGSDPESTNITGSQLKVEQGMRKDLILLLKVEPLRVDWILQAKESQNFNELPNLGDNAKALSTFKEITNDWFKNSKIPDIKRLAYGTRLYSIVDDRIKGYEELDRLLEFVEVHPETSSDFLYQINRSLSSATVDDLLINRLTKWHVANIKTVSIDTNAGQSKSLAQDVFATTLDLDINSDADTEKLLPIDKLIILFEEFISLGKEITVKGDFQ